MSRCRPGAPALAWSAHAFDPHRERHMLVGCTPGAMTAPRSGESHTWVTSSGGWTRIATPSSPDTRIEFGLTHDVKRRVTVLFAGQSYGLTHGDTWEFDGVQWTVKDRRPPITHSR